MDHGARNILIKVLDTGCGIPQQDMGQLLVPFKQVGGWGKGGGGQRSAGVRR